MTTDLNELLSEYLDLAEQYAHKAREVRWAMYIKRWEKYTDNGKKLGWQPAEHGDKDFFRKRCCVEYSRDQALCQKTNLVHVSSCHKCFEG